MVMSASVQRWTIVLLLLLNLGLAYLQSARSRHETAVTIPAGVFRIGVPTVGVQTFTGIPARPVEVVGSRIPRGVPHFVNDSTGYLAVYQATTNKARGVPLPPRAGAFNVAARDFLYWKQFARYIPASVRAANWWRLMYRAMRKGPGSPSIILIKDREQDLTMPETERLILDAAPYRLVLAQRGPHPGQYFLIIAVRPARG